MGAPAPGSRKRARRGANVSGSAWGRTGSADDAEDVVMGASSDDDSDADSAARDDDRLVRSSGFAGLADADGDDESAVKKLPVKLSSGQVVQHREDEEPEALQAPNSLSLVWRAGEQRKRSSKAEAEAEREQLREEAASTAKAKAKAKAEEEAEEAAPVVRLSAAQQLLAREDAKVAIARLASQVLGDPEAGVDQNTSGGCPVRRLLTLAAEGGPGRDGVVRKLALLSLVAVFKDILPGYRIRLATDKEKSGLLSKEVRKMQRFEKNTLEVYQAFLKLASKLVADNLGSGTSKFDHRKNQGASKGKGKGGSRSKSPSLALVAVRCLCTMLVAKPDFNFRENLLGSVVPHTNSPDAAVRAQCCACVSTLLDDDVAGDSTLQVVTFVSKLVRSRSNGDGGLVHPDVVDLLLHCNISADMKDSKTAKQVAAKKKAKKVKKRRNAVGHDIDNALREAEASVDVLTKHAQQIEALRELFTMYLRVLKRAPRALVVPQVLRGVAKYVHLINMDIAQALVTVLTSLIKLDTLDLPAGLQCVQTVALTLRGPGVELNVDESEFVSYLYRALVRLAAHPERDELVPSVVRAVEAVFLGRKLYQQGRVAAMVTRLAMLACSMGPHGALALVGSVRQLMLRYASACRTLLEPESDGSLGSNAAALGVIPVASNSASAAASSGEDPALLLQQDAAALWALSQLKFHYHPQVRAMAAKALAMAPLLPEERALKQYVLYDPSLGGFNPPVPKAMANLFFSAKARKGKRHKKNPPTDKR